MIEVEKKVVAYPLQRDFQASIRLYFQHWMWRRQLGYLLNPNIPVKEGFKLADIACGTGIWLIDFAKEHPGVQCDGYDISAEQFPVSGWLPKNVTLDCIDILKPIPGHLRGQYDIVHVGLVVLVVENDNPKPVLENLRSLLKPGGYLQWDEADFGRLVTSSPNDSISHRSLDEVKNRTLAWMHNVKRTHFEWVRELERYFTEGSFTNVDNRILPIPDDIALPWTLQHLMAFVEFIKRIDNPVGTAIDWWKLYEAAAEETVNGASMRMDMITCIGQKNN